MTFNTDARIAVEYRIATNKLEEEQSIKIYIFV